MNENNEVTNDDLKVEDVPEIEEVPDVSLEVQDIDDLILGDNDAVTSKDNNEVQMIESTDESQEEKNAIKDTNESKNSKIHEESNEIKDDVLIEKDNSFKVKESSEETKENSSNESNEVKVEPIVDIDASILTNEEVKNVDSDMITAPQENVELPKIEAEVITPINKSQPLETPKKKKKKKHPIKIIMNIFMWIIVLGWAGILIFDFIRAASAKEPIFCLENSTEKTSDGTINKCEGVGYNIYKYNYGSIKYIEFVPFWVEPKTEEELLK